MSEAAVGHPNVKALVYIASFILEPGETTSTAGGQVPRRPGSAGPSTPFLSHFPNGAMGNDLYIKQDEFRRGIRRGRGPEEDHRTAGGRPAAHHRRRA